MLFSGLEDARTTEQLTDMVEYLGSLKKCNATSNARALRFIKHIK